MHQQAMIHCDIKEPNLMIKSRDYSQPEVVVVDFGIAKAMGAIDTGAFGGTPGYIPPETLSMKKWFPGGDMFSLGVVMFQMTTDKTPRLEGLARVGGLFQEGCRSIEDIVKATMGRQPAYHLMPQDMPQMIRLTEKLLSKKLNQRPRAPQALKDAWFESSKPAVEARTDQ